MALRILYHHRVRDIDGQAVHVRALQRAFVNLGHELHEVVLVPLLPAARAGKGGQSVPAIGGEGPWGWVKRLPGPLLELSEYAFSLLSYRQVSRAIARLRPDVVYERYAFGNVGGVLAARRARIPHVLEVNSLFVRELAETRGLWLPGIGRCAERFVLARADVVCVVSDVMRDMVAEAGAPPERLLLTRNGVELEWFDYDDRELAARQARRRLGLEEGGSGAAKGDLVIGFTGYPREWNRLDTVLEAMTHEGMEHTRFVIVGDSPLVAQLGAMAGRLGVEERVTLAGARDHREVAALLPAFAVMVLPGVTEFSSPLKLHEWMAASLAIVAADLPNLREVLEHDRNCLLVPAGDAGALTAAVLALASDPSRRTRLGEAARADVVSRGLTWDSNARAVVAAVEEIRRRRAA